MSVIDDVKARIDIVELITPLVKLRKSGRAFTGLCPFHTHTNNTPSFAVWLDTGTWRCFGQCNDGGDAFKFVMKRDGVDFPEALRMLAAQAGVELKQRTPQEQEQDDNLDHLRQLLETATTYYQHLLKNAPGAAQARAHLVNRGLSDKAVEMFQLGYALDTWDSGLNYFTGKGYAQQDLLDAGLIIVKADGGARQNAPLVFDRFRDRLMIPVRDERGRMTGFQARALKSEALPKFMNSPQTALFDKGRTLFGLSLARKPIRDAGAAIVVEGNLDVIAAHQAGFANVVSSQGTALTEHQLRLLKKHAKRIILALDADEAGEAATLRGLMVAREALDREAEVSFDWRGLVRTEGRLGADIRVMTLPLGSDPDDVIRENPEAWKRLTATAEPVVEYVIRVLTTGRDLNDPKIKTEIAETVLPLIEDVAQPIERDTYRQKLSRVLRVDERSLTVRRTSFPSRPAPRAAPRTAARASVRSAEAESTPLGPPPENAPISKSEAFCLSALVRQPDLLYKLDRELVTLGLPNLAPGDFGETENQLIFRALQEALNQLEVEPADYLRDHLDPMVRARVTGFLSEAAIVNLETGKATEALMLAVLRMRRRTVRNWLNELRFFAEDAREQGDARAEAYQPEILRQAQALALVDRALARQGKRERVVLK
jgi:DNA primase